MTLSDINGNGLKWRPFNGSWINGKLQKCFDFFRLQPINFECIVKLISDEELVYRDPTGGLSILNVRTLTVRMLMTNTTFVSLNLLSFHRIE